LGREPQQGVLKLLAPAAIALLPQAMGDGAQQPLKMAHGTLSLSKVAAYVNGSITTSRARRSMPSLEATRTMQEMACESLPMRMAWPRARRALRSAMVTAAPAYASISHRWMVESRSSPPRSSAIDLAMASNAFAALVRPSRSARFNS